EPLYCPDMCHSLADTGISVLSAHLHIPGFSSADAACLLHSAAGSNLAFFRLADRIRNHTFAADPVPSVFLQNAENQFSPGKRSTSAAVVGRNDPGYRYLRPDASPSAVLLFPHSHTALHRNVSEKPDHLSAGT